MLIGAAAGYALIATRFRHFDASSAKQAFSAGTSEMRAAEAFTRDWARSVESEAAGGKARSAFGESIGGQQRRDQERRKAQQEELRAALGLNGPPQWALNELGLPADASMSAAKAAFRERAKASHPDSPGGDEAAFKRVNAAWEAVQKHKSEA